MEIVRCRDCMAFDPHPQIVKAAAPDAPRPDPDKGLCRAKLPKVEIAGLHPQVGPIIVTYMPEMHKDAGCAEGQRKPVVHV